MLLKSQHPQKSETPTLTPDAHRAALKIARDRATPKNAHTLFGLLGIVALTASPLLIFNAPIWLTPLLVVTGSIGMLMSAIIMHECAHESIFKPRAAQAWTGAILGVWCAMPFGGYKRGHRAHHKWSGHPTFDPTPSPQARRQPSTILNLLSRMRVIPILYWGGVYGPYFLYDWRPSHGKRNIKHMASSLLSTLTTLALLTLLTAQNTLFLVVYLSAFWLSGVLYEYLFTMQHHLGLQAPPPRGARHTHREQMHFARSTSTRLAPLIFYFNLHKEHHLAPGEHYSVLPHLHDALKTHHPQLYTHTSENWRMHHRREPFDALTAPRLRDT